MNRYDGRTIFRTSNDLYLDELNARGLKAFRYFATPVMPDIGEEDLSDIDEIGHVWSMGDRYYKLAAKYYNNPELWWVIAWYNGKPTEAHLKIGDVVSIPLPLWKTLSLLGV